MNSEYNVEFYRNFKKFVCVFMEKFYNIELNGMENIIEDENALFAGNHLNILDSWLLLYALDRELRFMVDQKLYRYKIWEKFFTSLGTFPIDPNNVNVKAVMNTCKLLKNDFDVVIFPEGKTHNAKEIVPFKPGIPDMARIAGKKTIPFAIKGSYIPFSKVSLTFGTPIDFKDFNLNKEEATNYLEEEVRKLEKSNGK